MDPVHLGCKHAGVRVFGHVKLTAERVDSPLDVVQVEMCLPCFAEVVRIIISHVGQDVRGLLENMLGDRLRNEIR